MIDTQGGGGRYFTAMCEHLMSASAYEKTIIILAQTVRFE